MARLKRQLRPGIAASSVPSSAKSLSRKPMKSSIYKTSIRRKIRARYNNHNLHEVPLGERYSDYIRKQEEYYDSLLPLLIRHYENQYIALDQGQVIASSFDYQSVISHPRVERLSRDYPVFIKRVQKSISRMIIVKPV